MTEYLANTVIHVTATERSFVENAINDVTVNLDSIETEVPANFSLHQLGATGVGITPISSLTANNVQDAIDELADEYYHKSASAPSNAVNGDVWYDTSEDVLKLYRNNEWVTLAGATGTSMSTFSGGTY